MMKVFKLLLLIFSVLFCIFALSSCIEDFSSMDENNAGVEISSTVNGSYSSYNNPLGFQFFLLDDGNYAIAAGGTKYLSTIEIPTTYNGKNVTMIAREGFKDCP